MNVNEVIPFINTERRNDKLVFVSQPAREYSLCNNLLRFFAFSIWLDFTADYFVQYATKIK